MSVSSGISGENVVRQVQASGMSPKRNRVTPLGDIVAIPLRGAWTGNRGILHAGFEIRRYHASNLWITCALEFRGWWREQWLPNRWTHLFFHDEAVSLAAGHRPCAECRRGDYNRYREAWARGRSVETPLATEINRQLHGERICAAPSAPPAHRIVGESAKCRVRAGRRRPSSRRR